MVDIIVNVSFAAFATILIISTVASAGDTSNGVVYGCYGNFLYTLFS